MKFRRVDYRFPTRPLGELVDVLDFKRRPVNSEARAKRVGPYPYYGANGQVGTIDDFLFDEPLILVAEDGGFFDDPVRPIAYMVDGKCWVNNHAHVLRARAGRVDREWLAYSVGYLDVRDSVNGATRPKLTQKDLLQLPVPMPSLAEQARIVKRIREAMERTDEIGRLRRSALAESNGLLPSLLKDVFVAVTAEQSAIPIASFVTETRYGTSEKCSSDESGTPVLRIPNVAAGRVNFEGLKYMSSAIDGSDRLALKEGDLLVVRTNGSPELVGRCAVVPQLDRVYAYASYLIRVRLDTRRADPRYVSYFLASTLGRDQIASKRHTSAGQFNINTQDIQALEVPLPPLPRQRELVQAMLAVEEAALATVAEITAASAIDDLIPTSVLRKAFAGEL